jgi:hypothetical protein
MGWTPTLAALAACFAVALICGWRGARPPDLARGPRLIPYRFLMLLAGAAVVLLLIHIRTLAGLGSDQASRQR